MENLMLNFAEKLLLDPLLHDLFLVSLVRILRCEKYINYIKSPLLKAEAHIHLNSNTQVHVDADVLEKALNFHPLGALIYIGSNFETVNRSVIAKATIFSYKHLDTLALVIGYTGSEELYKGLFINLLEERLKLHSSPQIAILLDFMTFRYCMDSVLPFTEDIIRRYGRDERIPDILRKTFTSTLLVSSVFRKGIASYEVESLLEHLRLSLDDLELLQAAPVLAKNIYFLGGKEVFKEILLRLNELRKRATRRYGIFDFIIPPSPERLSKDISRGINIINSILSVFDLLSRSDRFKDESFAAEYLKSLYKDLQSHLILYVLTKIELRANPDRHKEIISEYLSMIKRLSEEDPAVYSQLGSIFSMKYLTNEVRQDILRYIPDNFAATKYFVLGLYEETLKQYPLPLNEVP
ncbi:MAG: hypothetical protein NDP19_05225 [Crenarchaeota archaeon]|nr:hypothetical protein [Thermoproteota archaeon]